MRLILTLIAILIVLPALASDVKLQWQADPVAENLTKYTVKWGTTTGVHQNVIDFQASPTATITTETVSGLKPGVYFFIVTASSGSIESLPSNEVSATITPKSPAALVVVP